MKFLEKFTISDNGWKTAFALTSGDDVDVKEEDVVLYTLLPFGDLFLRMNKLNGSFDKIYIFIISLFADLTLMGCIFDIYEYRYYWFIAKWYIIGCLIRLIPALLAYFKKMNKVDEDQGNVIDAPIMIPLIARVLFGLAMFKINMYLGDILGPIANHVILFITIMFAMFIRLALRRQCNNTHWNKYTWQRFVKVFFDSLFIYGIIFLISSWVLGYQFVNPKYQMIFDRPVPYYGNMREFVLMVAWLLAILCGYAINNMIDINFNTKFEPPYDNDNVCKGTISDLRYAVAAFIFIYGSGKYVSNSSFNLMGSVPSFNFTQNAEAGTITAAPELGYSSSV